ncbi:MAG: Ni/Fe-hydrogenase, b-type cytochrome subunit [Gemmatimonadota bacterium]
MAADGSAAVAPDEEGGAPDEPTYRWVYIWQWPIRAMHWAAALAIVVLAITGFYIGKPYFMTGGEASGGYLMGTMRFVHFAAAGLLVATGIVRVYWLFAGNKYERLPALFPVRPRDWRNLFEQMKHYLMLRSAHAPHYLGHNPLQQFAYTGIYLVVMAEVLTGFSLYGLYNPGGFFYDGFAWLGPLLGGTQGVRFIHHVLTWVILIFIPIHIYLGIRADVTEREGAVSSIINGGRFVRDDIDYVDE